MQTAKPCVLCVDDEQLVLNSLHRLLRQDYDVLSALSGEDALKLLDANTVDVIISDQRMPGMRGVDFLRSAREKFPRSMRLLLTGYADLKATLGAVNEGEVFRYITKPWKNEELRHIVHSASLAAAATSPEISDQALHSDQLQDTDTEEVVLQAMADVLVIDADRQFCNFVDQALASQAKVFCATTQEQALNLLENYPSIGIVVSETRVSNGSVGAMLRALKAYHPCIIAVVASSTSDANVVVGLINHGQIFRYLNKPVSADLLSNVLRKASKMHFVLKQFPNANKRYQVELKSFSNAPELETVAMPESNAQSRAPQTPDNTHRHSSQQASPGALETAFPPLSMLQRIRGLFRG